MKKTFKGQLVALVFVLLNILAYSQNPTTTISPRDIWYFSGTNNLRTRGIIIYDYITLADGTITNWYQLYGLTAYRVELIENNTNNWNSAFSWGNHAGLYRDIRWVPHWTDIIDPPWLKTADTNGWVTATHDTLEPKLPATPANPTTMFLDGNRAWNPIKIGAGGYAGNLYFRTDKSTIDTNYSRINYDAESFSTTNTRNIAVAGTYQVNKYLFDSPLGVGMIDSGMWVSTIYTKVDKAIGVTELGRQIFVYTNGYEQVLFEAWSGDIDNTEFEQRKRETTQPTFTVPTNGYLGVNVYIRTTHNNVTVSTVIGNGNGSYFTTPLRIRHTQLRDFDGDPLYQHITSAERARLNAANTNETDLTTPYTPWTAQVPVIDGTATIAIVYGNMPYLVCTNVTVLTLDPAGYGTNGDSRISLDIWAGTNSLTLATNIITYSAAPTILTNDWSKIFIRRIGNGTWRGVDGL